MVAPKMQHRQLRRRVPAIIKRGEEPRDLAHLLADLERRQAPEPESNEDGASQPEGAEADGDDAASQPDGAESESSDSTGDGSSSGSSSSSSSSSKSKAESEAPKSSSPPTAGLPAPTTLPVISPPPAQNALPNGTVPNRGAIIVPVPAGINTPTTMLTSTTRAATSPSDVATPTPTAALSLTTASPSPSFATSPTQSLSSLLIPSPSPPALSLPLPVPSSSPGLVSSGVIGTSPPSATPEPAPTGATLNAGGTVSAVSGSGDAPGIIAGSIAGVACVTGVSIYLYRRYKSGEPDSQPALDQKPAGAGASTNSFASADIIITPPTDVGSPRSLGVPNDQAHLDRMTALDEKQYAAYRNLMGADR
ncbi:hypothetical protein PspLS_06949 [Pyricularia sp. CBS 133598]|nr:hypothetical protein PspLS_06949 [Pyricularia sp. CBS 133598]